MITGPANFPVRQQQKRSQWADNRATEMVDWQTRAKAAIRAKLLDARTPEEKAEAEWSSLCRELNSSLSSIVQVDECGSPFHRHAFTNSIAGKIERLAYGGEVDLVKKAIDHLKAYDAAHKKPAFTSRHKVWTFPELAERAAKKHDERISAGPEVIGTAPGVEVVINPEVDRVQIVFAAKPSIEMIGKLKAEAWNWSRTEGAWQRRITEAAKASAKRIVGIQ